MVGRTRPVGVGQYRRVRMDCEPLFSHTHTHFTRHLSPPPPRSRSLSQMKLPPPPHCTHTHAHATPPTSYHMWAAEMTEHCGIGTWQQNSRVIHATAIDPGGVYTRKDVVWEVFSHEPEVVPGPKGQYIMYFTADLRSQHGLCNCCRPGYPPPPLPLPLASNHVHHVPTHL
jgi:hypothetical protein